MRGGPVQGLLVLFIDEDRWLREDRAGWGAAWPGLDSGLLTSHLELCSRPFLPCGELGPPIPSPVCTNYVRPPFWTPAWA